MFKKFMRETVFALIAGVLLCSAGITDSRAASNISDTDKYAWSETAGWNNFKPGHANAGVTVYGDHLEGHAWAENIGWMKLNGSTGGGPNYYANTDSTNWGVNNDGSGNLSGFAWSEIAGWINFKPGASSGVTVNTSTGDFDGYAWGENVGWIHFRNDTPTYKVATIWRPNEAPVITAVTPDSITIAEGGSISLGGSFTDADAGDSHDVTINWGDDSTETEFTLGAGTLSFSDKQPHTYADDGSFIITVTVNDGTASVSDDSTTVSVVIPVVAFSSATYSDEENVGASSSVTLSRTVFTNCVTEVSVSVTDGDATGGTDYDNSGFPVTVTFNEGDDSRTVSVPVTDDAVDEEDETVTFSVSSVSNADIGTQDTATLTITDDDTRGVTVDPTTGLVTTESGGQATFTLVLDSQPTGDVSIGVSSDNTGEGTVSPDSLTFTAENWNVAQTVTVTGTDDLPAAGDGDVAYNIVLAAAESADTDYDGTGPLYVPVTNTDDPSEYDPGDVNGDGEVDLKDAVLCLKVLAGFTDLGKINLTADVHSDGRIGFEDLFFILKKLAR